MSTYAPNYIDKILASLMSWAFISLLFLAAIIFLRIIWLVMQGGIANVITDEHKAQLWSMLRTGLFYIGAFLCGCALIGGAMGGVIGGAIGLLFYWTRRQSRLPDKEGNKPNNVKKAGMILYYALGIFILQHVIKEINFYEKMPADYLWVSNTLGIHSTLIAFACLYWILIDMIGKGKNWARIIYLILCISYNIFSVRVMLETSVFTGFLSILALVTNGIALIFLFQKPSSDWFMQVNGNFDTPQRNAELEKQRQQYGTNQEKVIIYCENCGQKLRVPQGKHINVSCPHCRQAFVYDSR